MKYYIHKKNVDDFGSPSVYAYPQSDVDIATSIPILERELEDLKNRNSNNDSVDIFYEKERHLDDLKSRFSGILSVIENSTEMTEDEIELHRNPPKTKEQIESEARALRDSKLSDLDKVVMNPLRWNRLTDEQKNSIDIYYQSLLDIPQQKGFPENIGWPYMPDFIK